jgi:hypothetical protein
MSHGYWPELVEDRRWVAETRTAASETCTLQIIRHREGGRSGLVIYLHGAVASSAVVPPELLPALLDGLRQLGE